jgi:hypothetical protein
MRTRFKNRLVMPALLSDIVAHLNEDGFALPPEFVSSKPKRRAAR